MGNSGSAGAYGAGTMDTTNDGKPGSAQVPYEYKIDLANQPAAGARSSLIAQKEGENLWESILKDVVARDE